MKWVIAWIQSPITPTSIVFVSPHSLTTANKPLKIYKHFLRQNPYLLLVLCYYEVIWNLGYLTLGFLNYRSLLKINKSMKLLHSVDLNLIYNVKQLWPSVDSLYWIHIKVEHQCVYMNFELLNPQSNTKFSESHGSWQKQVFHQSYNIMVKSTLQCEYVCVMVFRLMLLI